MFFLPLSQSCFLYFSTVTLFLLVWVHKSLVSAFAAVPNGLNCCLIFVCLGTSWLCTPAFYGRIGAWSTLTLSDLSPQFARHLQNRFWFPVLDTQSPYIIYHIQDSLYSSLPVAVGMLKTALSCLQPNCLIPWLLPSPWGLPWNYHAVLLFASFALSIGILFKTSRILQTLWWLFLKSN